MGTRLPGDENEKVRPDLAPRRRGGRWPRWRRTSSSARHGSRYSATPCSTLDEDTLDRLRGQEANQPGIDVVLRGGLDPAGEGFRDIAIAELEHVQELLTVVLQHLFTAFLGPPLCNGHG